MFKLPFSQQQISALETCYIPSAVKSRNNLTYRFWERSLFQRALSTIIIDGSNDWTGSVKDFLCYCLFRFGFVACFETDELGKVFNPCTLSGYNFYYQPTSVLISNPTLKQSLNLKIGSECELLKLTPDYQGIYDIVSYYAEKLSTLDNAINISIINNKFSWLLAAKNKGAAETLKKIFDKINRGEPSVFFDSRLLNDAVSKDVPWQFLERPNLKQSYITTDQLMDFQTLLNSFDTEIGIPVLPYQKKERMVTSEAESKIIDATSRSIVWYDTLTASAEMVNEFYGIPDFISVKLRHDPDEKGVQPDE